MKNLPIYLSVALTLSITGLLAGLQYSATNSKTEELAQRFEAQERRYGLQEKSYSDLAGKFETFKGGVENWQTSTDLQVNGVNAYVNIEMSQNYLNLICNTFRNFKSDTNQGKLFKLVQNGHLSTAAQYGRKDLENLPYCDALAIINRDDK